MTPPPPATLIEMLGLCSFFATKPISEELALDEGRRRRQQEQVKDAGRGTPGPLIFASVELPTLFLKSSSGNGHLCSSLCLPSACLMRKLPASFVPAANTWLSDYHLPLKTMRAES